MLLVDNNKRRKEEKKKKKTYERGKKECSEEARAKWAQELNWRSERAPSAWTVARAVLARGRARKERSRQLTVPSSPPFIFSRRTHHGRFFPAESHFVCPGCPSPCSFAISFSRVSLARSLSSSSGRKRSRTYLIRPEPMESSKREGGGGAIEPAATCT